MSDIHLLADTTRPERSVLFFGAGASVPSGGPTASEFADQLSEIIAGAPAASTDFNEECSILELRYGRRALVDAVRAILAPLEPSGGMLGVAAYPWSTIYTTNYDRLVEISFERSQRTLAVVRSNFDYGPVDLLEGTPLFKIHGCITQDHIDGHRAAMLLTENDLRDFAQYREVLFRQLALDLSAKDVIVIGNSLSDPHLKSEIDQVLDLHRESGAPGRLSILTYEHDADRAALLENRGATVAFGDLDEFLYAMAGSGSARATPVPTHQALPPDQLGAKLSATVTDVAHASSLTPNPSALFNGRAATFADIRAGLTFERASEAVATERLVDTDLFLSIIGAGGVGKTTLARRIASRLYERGFVAWQHRNQFAFNAQDWIAVERRLSAADRVGVLMIDDCTEFLGQINTLANHLMECDRPGLKLILTAAFSQWRPRLKSAGFYGSGTVVELSQLVDSEIESMLNLVGSVESIRTLVDSGFQLQSRSDQRTTLRRKCSADMYVCLKNVFATEGLDAILLQEFASLEADAQDVYRSVAAIEALRV